MKLIIEVELWCPRCGVQHVDETRNGERWDRRAHTTHRCQACKQDFDVYVSGAPARVQVGLSGLKAEDMGWKPATPAEPRPQQPLWPAGWPTDLNRETTPCPVCGPMREAFAINRAGGTISCRSDNPEEMTRVHASVNYA